MSLDDFLDGFVMVIGVFDELTDGLFCFEMVRFFMAVSMFSSGDFFLLE